MTLVVFAIHTLCEFVHCVFVCVSAVECFGTCDLLGAFVGWFIILAQFALNFKKPALWSMYYMHSIKHLNKGALAHILFSSQDLPAVTEIYIGTIQVPMFTILAGLSLHRGN